MSDLRHKFGKLSLGMAALLDEHREAVGAGGFCIGVTSARPKEGKTFIASGLAAAAAALGRERVLLVDANFEAPALHRLYRDAKGPGFSDCLAADDPECAEAVESETPNLYLLPAGKRVNPELLYRRGSISQFLRHARRRYDLIVFDCGALNSVGGSGVTEAADKILLVVDAGRTRRELARHAMQKISDEREDALWGVVLNKKEQYLPGFLYNRF
jgi:Mrp family chromosome partitioning ATPase